MYCLEEGKLPRLVCRPMPKFFNWNENPFTIGLDPSNIDFFADKLDGSLISTFLDPEDNLRLKSKQDLFSEHAKAAMAYLNKEENFLFKQDLLHLARQGYTVNMEWTSPVYPFRIVVKYDKPELRVLNYRNNYWGYMCTGDQFPQFVRAMLKSLPKHVLPRDKYSEWIKGIENETGVEGYVIHMKNGQLVKHKTNWYKSLHLARDSVYSPRRLFECLIDESLDDLKEMFFDDSYNLEVIKELEDRVIPKFNHYIASSEKFVEENKSLDRKSFAIKGQKELPSEIFSSAMMNYLGKPFSWKDWAKKNYGLFGVKDEEQGNADIT